MGQGKVAGSNALLDGSAKSRARVQSVVVHGCRHVAVWVVTKAVIDTMRLGHDGGTPLSVRLGSRFTSRPIDPGVCSEGDGCPSTTTSAIAIVHMPRSVVALLLNDDGCIILADAAASTYTRTTEEATSKSLFVVLHHFLY